MKKIFYIILFLQISCNTEPIKYKKVVLITATTQTMMVTHSDVHDNRLSRAAGGAAIGYLLGGKMRHGLIGGAIGLATSDAPTQDTYKKIETEITYHIKFSNGDSTKIINYCGLRVGDSIEDFYYTN